MIAQPGQETAANVRIYALFDILHPGPVLTHRDIEFTFTGDRTGMATDAAPDIDDHAILFALSRAVRAGVFRNGRPGRHQGRSGNGRSERGRGRDQGGQETASSRRLLFLIINQGRLRRFAASSGLSAFAIVTALGRWLLISRVI